MSIRDNLDISAYLVLGPENTLGTPRGRCGGPGARRRLYLHPGALQGGKRPRDHCADRRRRAGNRTGRQDRSGRLADRRPPGLRTRRARAGYCCRRRARGPERYSRRGLPQAVGPRCHRGPFGPLRGDARVRQDRRHEPGRLPGHRPAPRDRDQARLRTRSRWLHHHQEL